MPANALAKAPGTPRNLSCLSGSSESMLMFTRSRPAWRSSSATSRNVAPLVVIDRSGLWPASGDELSAGTRSCASFDTSTGRCARTVGSPPVRRRPSTSKRSTKMRERRSISSNVRTSLRGTHCIPSSGMQYVQRKLQRSVTEMRRSRIVRPNGSTRSISSDYPVRRQPCQASASSTTVTSSPTARPSPSGTIARPFAAAVAANWWLP